MRSEYFGNVENIKRDTIKLLKAPIKKWHAILLWTMKEADSVFYQRESTLKVTSFLYKS